MTPFRSHGRGTLVLKGTFGGIRIERASGTNDPKRLKDLKAMCRTLADKGRLDILEAIARPRGLAPLEAWQHSGDWSRIPTPEHARTLETALETWRQTVKGDRRRRDLASTIRTFIGELHRAVVGELPQLLLAYRNTCQAAGIARQFNKTRSELSSFLKDRLTQQHPLWTGVRAVPPLKVVRKRKGNPQTVAAALAVRATLGAEAGEAWWRMCATGMMPDEFFGEKFRTEDGRLHVLGTKTGARDRYAPLILDDLAPSLLTQEQFQRILKKSGLGVQPYDARRTFKHWCDVAGIPSVRSEIYMGHETGYRMDTLYGTHESERYLEADEAALRTLLVKETVGFPVGQPPAESSNFNGPTRNRTENLLIKRHPAVPASNAIQQKQSDLAKSTGADKAPERPDDTP